MASNTITPSDEAGPLAFLTKLSPEVYHFRPPPATPPSLDHGGPPISTSSSPPPPKMIVVFSWLAARDMHIAKYLRPYQALYPSSEILLVRSEMLHFLFPRAAKAQLEAFAVPVIRAAFPETDPDIIIQEKKPRVLIHVFSGGGSFMLSQLRTLLAPAVPAHTVVFDSCPPQFHYWGSYLATVGGWTAWMKRLLWPAAHLLCVWFWVHHRIIDRRAGGPLGRIAAVHNERDGRAAAEVRRAYVYGPGDELIWCEDIEWHARDATEKGFQVRLERFEGSAHVQHVRVDEDRYWRIARETWEGGSYAT